MDIIVKGRHTEIPERFRAHVAEKLTKVAKLDSKVISVDVECSQERNPRLSDQRERIELTIRSRGPVLRAEAAAPDCYAALDAAVAKLETQLRRAHDRRRVHHGGKTPVSVAAATAGLVDGASADTVPAAGGDADDASDRWLEGTAGDDANLPVNGSGLPTIREKVHTAEPMTLDQALYEMELVGHDFYLFVDADSGRPGVVYRRRGYDYGVIRLAT